MKRLFLLLPLLVAGCSINLLDPNAQSTLKQPTPTYVGGVPNPWYLYEEAYNTSDWIKGVAIWDAYWYVTVDFNHGMNPASGSKCIRVNFNNTNPVPPTVPAPPPALPTWAELAFIHSTDFSTFGSTPAINISAGAFTKCKFMIRTSVTTTVPIEMQGVAAVNVAATMVWKEVTINLNGPAQSATKTFFQINTPAVMPLDIFIDDLRYEK